MDRFKQYKKGRLQRKDKSSIQSWDKKIEELCNTINSLKDYCTVSSCSGRAVLLIKKDKKLPNLFVMRTHNLITFDELKQSLEETKGKIKDMVFFKQEPCLVTVACSSLEKQRELFFRAFDELWGKCGIITTEKNYIIELMATDKLELPIMDNGKILVDDEFLKILIERTNNNLKKSWNKIKNLENNLKNKKILS